MYVCFHNKSYMDDYKIVIDGLEVNGVQVTKFLGVLVDERLSWSKNI